MTYRLNNHHFVGLQLHNIFLRPNWEREIIYNHRLSSIFSLFDHIQLLWCILGNLNSSKTEKGILFRVSETIFEYILSNISNSDTVSDHKRSIEEINVSVSCLEIYQEKLYDLLVPAKSDLQSKLRIRENIQGEVFVEGLKEIVVQSLNEFQEVVLGSIRRRAAGAHAMNHVSSRSHFCCTIHMTQLKSGTREKIMSKMHVIDLAGSELVHIRFSYTNWYQVYQTLNFLNLTAGVM